jgi:hypothetical protein
LVRAVEAFYGRLARCWVACLPTVPLLEQGEGAELRSLAAVDWLFVDLHALPADLVAQALDLATDAVVVAVSAPPLDLSQRAVDFWLELQVGGSLAVEALHDLSAPGLELLQQKIAQTVAQREALKAEMAAWYDERPNGPFPKRQQLTAIDADLSRLDSCFKRQWDARHGK